MTKADNWLIECFQWLYDYAWDRWGIMVGMVGQIAMVADFGIDCLRGSAGVWSVIWIIGLLILLEFRSILQRNGSYAPLNEGARDFRDGPMRPIRLFFTILIMFTQILANGFLGALSGILFAIFSYSYCLMVRDRDEGRFKEHKLAYQENRNG